MLHTPGPTPWYRSPHPGQYIQGTFRHRPWSMMSKSVPEQGILSPQDRQSRALPDPKHSGHLRFRFFLSRPDPLQARQFTSGKTSDLASAITSHIPGRVGPDIFSHAASTCSRDKETIDDLCVSQACDLPVRTHCDRPQVSGNLQAGQGHFLNLPLGTLVGSKVDKLEQVIAINSAVVLGVQVLR